MFRWQRTVTPYARHVHVRCLVLGLLDMKQSSLSIFSPFLLQTFWCVIFEPILQSFRLLFFKTWACAKKQITIVCSYWMKWNIKAHLDSIVFVHKSVIISEWVCDFQQQENSNLLLSRSFVHEPASRACGWEGERAWKKQARHALDFRIQ